MNTCEPNVEKLDDWLASEEGQKEVAENLARANEAIRVYEEVTRLSHEDLNEPTGPINKR